MMKKTYGKEMTALTGGVLSVFSLFNCAGQLKVFSVAASDIILPDSEVLAELDQRDIKE